VSAISEAFRNSIIASTFGLGAREQLEIVEAISQAVSEVAPAVRAAMRAHPAFEDIGKRMLLAWEDGINGLRNKTTYALARRRLEPKLGVRTPNIGRSELLGRQK